MKHIYTLDFWKDIEGYEGLYQVSNTGQVKSVKSGKILKPDKRKEGYLQIGLYKEGKKKKFLIHRLVAAAFLPNEDELSQVDHINNAKTDNRVCNLQWISHVENNRKRETGIMIPKRVICVETGEIFESVSAAARAINRKPYTVSKHLKGILKTCAGKHFKYYYDDEDVISSDANSILFGIRPKDLKESDSND